MAGAATLCQGKAQVPALEKAVFLQVTCDALRGCCQHRVKFIKSQNERKAAADGKINTSAHYVGNLFSLFPEGIVFCLLPAQGRLGKEGWEGLQ